MIRARDSIATPMLEFAELLLSESPQWLSSFLRLSCMEGEGIASRHYADTIARRPSGPKAATVEVGSATPDEDDESVIIPIRWRVQGYKILPNRFDGRLVLSPGADSETEVELFGNWALDPRDHPDFETRLAARAAAEAAISRLLANLRVALAEAAQDTA